MCLYGHMLGREVDWTLGAEILRHVSTVDRFRALTVEEMFVILTLGRHLGPGRQNQWARQPRQKLRVQSRR